MSKGGDAKFFSTTKKGEIPELKGDLNSTNRDKVKEAVKKVIASMTVGKDVSSLFTDVVKSMASEALELKKLVYLYIINYARAAPDKAILVVNTFQRDAAAPSPLVRALAIRTMACIRVDRITEYLAEPLSRALRDKDPYVRKTAAIAVAKLYDIAPELVKEQGLIDTLRDLTSDSNPMVVANAVAGLHDISLGAGNDVFKLDSNMLAKLLAALNECTEWGQVFILDALASYKPTSAREAEDIIERVTPRLKHANAAVVMSAVKVIMAFLGQVAEANPKLEQALLIEKLPPPLITLLSEHRPEIQYVALRNLRLLVLRYPTMLAHAVKHFFCKYNDPIYVKMEKLELLVALASSKNVDKVLLELKEYASEVDVEFVRRAVNAIGRCAIRIEAAAERCVQVLLELIQSRVQYVVQEAIVVIRDIFRRYPNRYESIIATLCDALESLDEPEAKSAMVWIIGEYADRIDNAPELLEQFVEHWDEEPAPVQLALLTATVKLFLKRPDDAKELVGRVLQLATANADNPDLRDRGYIYWRLLATDPEAAQQVVLASKPTISDDTFQMDASLLDTLMTNIATLASVYHKPPEFFVKDAKAIIIKNKGDRKDDDASEEEESEEEGEGEGGEGGEDEEEEEEEDEEEEVIASPKQASASPPASGSGAVVDLLGLMSLSPVDAAPKQAATPSSGSSSSSAALSQDPLKVVLAADSGKGLSIRSRVARRGGNLFLDMQFDNQTSGTLSQFAIKFNDNYVGVTPGGPLSVGGVNAGSQKNYSLPLTISKPPTGTNIGIVQVAIKTELGVFYWNQSFPSYHLFEENAKLEDKDFLNRWKNLPDDKESTQLVQNSTVETPDEIKARLEPKNIFFIASRVVNKSSGASATYFSLRFKGIVVLAEVKLEGGSTHLAVKSEDVKINELVIGALVQLLSS